MKRVLAVRHAKAAHPTFDQKDFDRPLHDRGKKDAHDLGQRLAGEGIVIDRFVSSPAKRAKKTCKAFVEEYNRGKEEIVFFDELYNAPESVFYEVIEQMNNADNSIAVFAHNPGITAFVNSLRTERNVGDMPTCGVFAVDADITDWKDFRNAEKKLVFFEYPKMEL